MPVNLYVEENFDWNNKSIVAIWSGDFTSGGKLKATLGVPNSMLADANKEIVVSYIAKGLATTLMKAAMEAECLDEAVDWHSYLKFRIADILAKSMGIANPCPDVPLPSGAALSMQAPVQHISNKHNPELPMLAKSLPGVNELVAYPCGCINSSRHDSLMSVIIHLNDKHVEWDRNRIADWIESLDVDTEFK